MHKYDTKFVNSYGESPELVVNTSQFEPAKIVSQPCALICAQRASKPASESIPSASLQYVPEFIPHVSSQRSSDFDPRINGSKFAPSITGSEFLPRISSQQVRHAPVWSVSMLHHDPELVTSATSPYVYQSAPLISAPRTLFDALFDAHTYCPATEPTAIIEHSCGVPTSEHLMPTLGHKIPVDAWIDIWNPLVEPFSTGPSTAPYLCENHNTMDRASTAPKLKVSKFDSSPIKWIDFIVRFKDMVR